MDYREKTQASIYSNVLKKIKPSDKGKIKVEQFLSKLFQKAKEFSGMPSVCVGSVGKGTWLSGDHDIDLFIIFPRYVKREDLEKKGLELGKKLANSVKGRIQMKYAEHPYIRFFVNNFIVDVVPCYEMKMGEHIQSAVDRSPLHLEFVKSKIAGKEDDVRLLKQFCKGVGVYGSDAKNLGISGYICELLVIKYGSFEAVLNALSEIKAGFVVNLTGKTIDARKFKDQPMIVIDPVDHERNAAAVVSGENFIKLSEAARSFLKKPSEKYFIRQKTIPLNSSDLKQIGKRGTEFYGIVFKRPDIIDDIVYPQMHRLSDRLEGLMRYNEFLPLNVFDYADDKNIAIVLEMETWSLPNIKKMEGPPVFAHKNSEEFRNKYKNARVAGLNWHAEVQRKYKTPNDLLADFFSQTTQESGVPKHLIEEAKKAKVLQGKSFWKFALKNKGFSAVLRDKLIS
ncbi:MAG: CCA tRNA nucleotidyltransferase [Candidatus Aenigmarchaeota archaeon]|nr:CCA tRNA nucleotidyltransferase [Candidatus Aenigmarchaeota archaeon]